MLSGLIDDDSEVQREAVATLTLLGDEFEENNREKLKDELFYGDEAEEKDHSTKLVAILAPPFTTRPDPRIRAMVKRFISRYIPAVITEVKDWLPSTQQRSILLMRTLLILAESNISVHVPDLIATFQRLVSMDGISKAIMNDVIICMQLVGRHVRPVVYMPILISITNGRHGCAR
jgi:hypothetical protein